MSPTKPKSEAPSPLAIVIFVGGSGTRMWPMSRKSQPKQFQNLIDSNQSMFQQMLANLTSTFSIDQIFISTNADYAAMVLEQAPGLNPDHIITEPELRDTTAAVGYAAVQVAHRFPGAMMATIWGGDHLIRNRLAFTDALQLAHTLAEQEKLTVQINVRPTFASTALGYVETGDPILSQYGKNIYSYVRQVEKPDEKTARQFLSSVNYLWHSGYRVWRTDTLLELYRKHVPDAYQALLAIQKSLGTEGEAEVTRTEYAKIIKKSIDYTIFEHLDKDGQAVIAADLGWNDIGTWQVLHAEMAGNPEDNVSQGLTLLDNVTGSLVYGQPDKLIALVGVDDLIVVDTEDALLVIPKDKASQVKELVAKIKEQGRGKFL